MTQSRRSSRGALALLLACAGTCACAKPAFGAEGATDPAAPLPPRDIHWSAALGGAIDTVSAPHATPGLALGLDVRRGQLAGRLVASAFLPQRESASGADVGLFDVMATACALVPVGSIFDFGPCAGLGVGLLRAEPSAASGAALAVRPEGLATTRWDVTLAPSLVLSLDAGMLVDPLRTRLPLEGARARGSLVSFRGALAMLVRFW